MPRRTLSDREALEEKARFALEGRIQRTYAKAYNSIQKKLDAFLDRFREADARWRKRLAAGEVTEEEYRFWKRAQVFRGKRWYAMRDAIAEELYRANQRSVDIINRTRTNVFSDAANHEIYELDERGRMGMNWTIYNREAVERILRDEPDLLPEKHVVRFRDISWNRRNVNSAVEQGIIQGEGIPQISKRIAEAVGSANKRQATTLARTIMTGALNAGRLEAMRQAASLGIKLKKQWIATLDYRTRDTHGDLDGQTVDINEPFTVNGQEIMEPGDPNAPLALIINCRCSMVPFHVEYPPQATKRRDNETGEVIPYMTYKEWIAQHPRPTKGRKDNNHG